MSVPYARNLRERTIVRRKGSDLEYMITAVQHLDALSTAIASTLHTDIQQPKQVYLMFVPQKGTDQWLLLDEQVMEWQIL